MNKEQAEICRLRLINSMTNMSKKLPIGFLLVNLFLIAITIIIYQGLVFVIVLSIIAFFNVIITLIQIINIKNYIKSTFLFILNLIILCVVLNCLVFSFYKLNDNFLLWEFVVSILIQIVAFIISFIIVKKNTASIKKQSPIRKKNLISGTIASLTYAIALVLCRIFNPSFEIALIIVAVIINLLVCFLSFAIVGLFYYVYWILKFKLC